MDHHDAESMRLLLARVDDVDGADGVTRERVSNRTEEAETASAALRGAITELHEADDAAWQRYAADIRHATLRFDAAVSMASATLRAEQAASKPALEDAMEAVATKWRARADELRVQTRLSEMDARDAGLHALDRLEGAGHQVSVVLATLRDDTDASLTGLREAAGKAIDGVAVALQNLDPRH